MQQGDILDNTYQIMGEIGSGGGGIVYKAFHLRLKKIVIIKRIRENYLEKVNARGEVDILKNLHHPNLPQVYDFFQIENQVFSAMEYIKGQDLEQYIKKGWIFKEAQLVKWLKQLCSVLQYLHEQKPPVFHCDIKPANIMVNENGDAVLIDFNISLHEGEEDLLGISYQYASPEQYEKARFQSSGSPCRHIVIDGRTDIYSLGAVFYRLMTGRQPSPIAGGNLPIEKCCSGYTDGMIKVVEKAMYYDPHKRYSNVRLMLEAAAHMEKLDKDYKRTGLIYGYGIAFCILGLALGIWLAAAGMEQNRSAAYLADKQLLQEYLDGTQSYEMVKLGEDMLQNGAYKRYFSKDPDKEAQILYVMGIGYWREGNDLMAAWYLSNAIGTAKDSEGLCVYYKDYIMLLLDGGNIEGARQTLEKAVLDNVTSDNLKLLEGRIFAAQEDYEKAWNHYMDVVNMSRDHQLIGTAYIYAAEICRKCGKEEDTIVMLEEAEKYISGRRLLRQLAEAYMNYAMLELQSAKAHEYRQKAIACYENINAMQNPAFLDKLNLAILYVMDGQDKAGMTKLQELESSGDYRVFMYQAYAGYHLQTFQEVLIYYNKAQTAYVKAGSPADDNMDQLRLLIKEIKQ